MFLAAVENFQVIPFGPGTVRVTWERIDVEAMDFEHYRYVIYYEEVGTLGLERSVSVRLNSSFRVIRDLVIDVEYQFAVAVSRQVGTETYTGERSLPEILRVQRGAASAETRSKDNGGKQYFVVCSSWFPLTIPLADILL